MEEPQSKRAKFTEASSSSTSVTGNNYYIFLSFRGPDTRTGFTNHLYHRLLDVGLPFHPNFVFRDDEELRYGEGIFEQLLSAIEHSKVSIPIISETYAASKWCLRELIHIMECKESRGQIVLPVFYKVERNDVKKMQGKFRQAFDSNMAGFDEEVKQLGPVALRKAADIKVFESDKLFSGLEGELVEKLVQVIMDKWQQGFRPPLPGNLVGTNGPVAEVMNLANTDPFTTRIIGICGIGGIGKTTLATNIYNNLFNNFECRSFLRDIRETINCKGMDHIQFLLKSDMTKNHGGTVRDRVMGNQIIQVSGENKKVLIVLDDVDHRDHLDQLIDGCRFKSGSRIIITCRDKAILKSEYYIYELKELNSEDSMHLFSSYAFQAKQPRAELVTEPRDIVATTRGLPLALKIIGSFLNGKDKSIWIETLQKLRKVPHVDVQQKLRISYDSLEYEQQQMFLDIACFFIGTEKKIAAYLWKDLQYCPDSGLERMIELSLMEVDANDRLRMHDQLRDLGRAIACPAHKKPWKCSRLWDEKAIIVQRSKENRNIEALHLDESGSDMFMNRKSFKRMPYLKFLRLSKVDFHVNVKDSLSELRWLEWQNCRDPFKATNVLLKKLLILDLSKNGHISFEWRGWSSIKMERLKVLNLSRCFFALKTTPNLSMFKSLEMLILEECENLEEIDPSIGDVKCLISLNLRGCHHLLKLPSKLGELRGLVSLNLAYCTKLLELPKEMGKLKNLKELTINGLKIKKIPRLGSLKKLETLNAQCTSLIELPNSISHLVNLSTLDLRFCMEFEGFPNSIGSLVKLQRLLLGNKILPSENDWEDGWNSYQSCPFSHIPPSIGNLESLTELYLTCTKISKLPKSIGKLKKLKILDIARCEDLSSLPNTISKLGKLEELDATACNSLEGGVAINGLSSLKILRLGKLGYTADLLEKYDMDFLSLDDYPSFQDHLNLTNCNFPASLTVLKVTCHNRNLPQLSHLIHLKELSFQFCEFLESIPELPLGILNFWVVFCVELKKLPSLLRLELLSELHIIGCSKLKKIEDLEGLKSLRGLSICECKNLLNLYGLEHLEYLRELKIEELDASIMNDYLFQVQCLGRLKNLETLHITRCQYLTRLDISQLINLEVLLVYECEDVDIIKGLERLKKLRCLNIKGCESISKLHIIGCGELMEIEGLKGLKSLRRLFVRMQEVAQPRRP